MSAETPIRPMRTYPTISHVELDRWAAECERCGVPIYGLTPGGVVSEHAVHTTREHNTAEVGP